VIGFGDPVCNWYLLVSGCYDVEQWSCWVLLIAGGLGVVIGWLSGIRVMCGFDETIVR